MPKWIVQISIALILGVAGQLILKEGAGKLDVTMTGATGIFALIWRMLTNPQIFLGLVCYGISSIFWILVLKEKPLSMVYPLIGSTYILVVLFAWLIRGEVVSLVRWVGAAVITLGVILISKS
jgi:drug/metabolite transporter (DMT)-like permease